MSTTVALRHKAWGTLQTILRACGHLKVVIQMQNSGFVAPNYSHMSDKTASRYTEVSCIVNTHGSNNYGRIRQLVVKYSWSYRQA